MSLRAPEIGQHEISGVHSSFFSQESAAPECAQVPHSSGWEREASAPDAGVPPACEVLNELPVQ